MFGQVPYPGGPFSGSFFFTNGPLFLFSRFLRFTSIFPGVSGVPSSALFGGRVGGFSILFLNVILFFPLDGGCVFQVHTRLPVVELFLFWVCFLLVSWLWSIFFFLIERYCWPVLFSVSAFSSRVSVLKPFLLLLFWLNDCHLLCPPHGFPPPLYGSSCLASFQPFLLCCPTPPPTQLGPKEVALFGCLLSSLFSWYPTRPTPLSGISSDPLSNPLCYPLLAHP